MDFLGIVVNPKLSVPCLVAADGGNVEIRAMSSGYEELGSGYYGMDDAIATVTGLPRSHTPSGVSEPGQGYGTCLYTALCLGAHQNYESHEGHPRRFRIGSYGPDGDGICSTSEDRSGEADEWWSKAKRRGLTRAVTEEQEDEDVDVTTDFDALIEGQEYGDGIVSRVTTITADVSKSIEGDIYLYDQATRHNLVIADFTVSGVDPTELWRAIAETPVRFIPTLSRDLIFALDVRGLDISAMNLLGLLAEKASASDTELHDFRYRWEAGLDPATPVKQMRLAFKKNSSEERTAERALARADALRSRTRWSALESLP